MLVATATLLVCLLCNQLISSGTALNVNIVLDGTTAKLDIQCTNTGCKWKGKYEDHMQYSNDSVTSNDQILDDSQQPLPSILVFCFDDHHVTNSRHVSSSPLLCMVSLT